MFLHVFGIVSLSIIGESTFIITIASIADCVSGIDVLNISVTIPQHTPYNILPFGVIGDDSYAAAMNTADKIRLPDVSCINITLPVSAPVNIGAMHEAMKYESTNVIGILSCIIPLNTSIANPIITAGIACSHILAPSVLSILPKNTSIKRYAPAAGFIKLRRVSPISF